MTMNVSDKKLEFYRLFEQLVSAMTDFSGIDIPYIEQTLIEICTLLRLSKAVTRLYRNPKEEAAGGGETLCCFDTGKPGNVIRHIRVVTSVMSIGTLTSYISPDEPPLSDEELSEVDLVMRTTLSFLSRNRLRDIVEELAYFDDAGFRNTRSLMSYLEKMNMTGSLGGKVAIHYNLRHFTLVNHEIGRKNADIVLKRHFAELEQMIDDQGILVRLGGDNFTVICSVDRLSDILEYLTEAKVIYDDKNGDSVSISASVGVYRLPEGFIMKSHSEIMNKILASSRAAQSGGKEHIVFYDESMGIRRDKIMRVQQRFPQALRNREFKVYYQPKVNVKTGEIMGAEALCRWVRKGEVIYPGDFIPALEETNDICKLDMYMLDSVCKDLKRWLDCGQEPVRISVNLSRKHMMNSGLVETINELIEKNGIPADYIEMELTETTTDVEFSDLKRVVSSFRQSGIHATVDDFGVGYSSLNLIRDIPWNIMKIDRSILPDNNDDNKDSRTIMFRFVVAMAKEMGLECVAEGVETKMHLEVLRKNSCDVAQGFLFDRPLPVDEFEKKLEKRFYDI